MDELAVGPWRVDVVRRVATAGSTRVRLTDREAEVLASLADRRGEPVSRDVLHAAVFGIPSTTTSRAVDATIRRLRVKLERDPAMPELLLTEHGAGYLLAGSAAPDAVEAQPEAPPTGRAALVAQLVALEGERLVTMIGVAGVGKSTLARHVRATCPWADVEGVTDALGLVAAVADALEVAPDAVGREDVQLGRVLARRGGRIVLDGAEAGVDAVRRLVGGWLDREPGVRVLVTSRERLGVEGEVVVAVPPLPRDDAVVVLQERAGRPLAASALAPLADALAGVPLALVLAGARLSVASPRQVLERLGRGVLVDRTGADGDRHRSIAGALSSSWVALSAELRAALQRCAAFHAPFDLPAAEAVVVAGDGRDTWELLLDLIDASWIERVEAADDLRYTLLPVVRRFVCATPGATEVLSDARRALARWYVDHGERCVARLRSERPDRDRRWIVRQRRHLEAVADADEPELAARATLLLGTTLRHHGPIARLVPRLDRVVEDARVPPALRARALVQRGWLAWDAGRRTPARYDFEDALELAPPGALYGRSRALAGMARVKVANQAPKEAHALYLQARELALQDGDDLGARMIQQHLVGLLVALGRPSAEVEAGVRAAVADARAADDPWTEGALVGSLAHLLFATGRPAAEVVPVEERAIACFEAIGDRKNEAQILVNLALVHEHAGVWDAAADAAARAATVYGELGHVVREADVAGYQAVLERYRSRRSSLERARELARIAADSALDAVLDVAEGELMLLDGRVDDARRMLLRAIGDLDGAGHGYELAAAHERLGCAHLLRGEPDEALPRLARARRTWSALPSPFLVLRASCLMAVAEAQARRFPEARAATMAIRVGSGNPRAARIAELTEAYVDVRGGGARAAARWYRRLQRPPAHRPLEVFVVDRLLEPMLD